MDMNKSTIKAAIIAAIMPVILSSCASIFSGGSPKITIDGNVAEPVTITTSKKVYSNVRLPYVVKVKRHKLNGQRIYVRSATTRYKDIVLEKKVNGWAFGNILLGGIPGWAIDLGTNAVSKPKEKHFYIFSEQGQHLQKEQPTQVQQETNW